MTPEGLALTPDETRLYVTHNNSNRMVIIVTPSHRVIGVKVVGYGFTLAPVDLVMKSRGSYFSNFLFEALSGLTVLVYISRYSPARVVSSDQTR